MKSIEIKRTILLAAAAILLLASVSVFATTAQAQTPPQGVDTAERDDVVPEDKEDDSAPDSAQDGTPPTGVDTAERDDEVPEGKEDDSAPDSGQEGGTLPAGVDTAERDDVVPEDDGRAARAADLAPAPTGLRATTYTGTSVSLSWRAVTDAASYRVEYRKSGSSRWLVAGYASSGTSYKVSRLVCNTTYYFQVRARGDGSPYSYTYGTPSTSLSKKTGPCIVSTPTGLKSTASTETSVSLSWKAVANAAAYKVEYRRIGSSSWRHARYVYSGTPYDAPSLLCNTTYQFQVRARGNGKTYSTKYSDPSTSLSKKTGLCIVSTPTSLKSTASTETSVSLSWKAVANAAAYKVEYRKSGSTSWLHADYVYSGASYTAPSLLCNTTYQFQVRARGNGKTYSTKYSDPSTSVSKKPGPCIPSAPTGVSSTASGPTSVKVSWSPVSGIAKYRVERRTGTSGSWSTVSSSATGPSYTVSGFVPGTSYYFRVSAYGDGKAYAAKWSAVSAVASTTTHSRPAIAISGLVGSLQEGGSDSFTVSASNLVSSRGYSIKVTTSNSDVGFDSKCSDRTETATVPSSRTSYSKTLTLYGCDTSGGTVKASLLRGTTSIATDTYDVRVGPTISLSSVPSSLKAGAASGFTVTANYLNPSHAYRIRAEYARPELGARDDCSYTEADRTSKDFTGRTSYSATFTVYGCSAGAAAWITTGLHRVISGAEQDSAIISDTSGAITVTAVVPRRVSSPSVSPNDRRLIISWSAPFDGGAAITHYHVQYDLTTASTWIITKTSGTDTTTTVSGLTNGSSYHVQVQGCNSVGCGSWSGSAIGTPQVLPAPPTNLSIGVDPKDDYRMMVTYTYSASRQRHYQIELHAQAMSSGSGAWAVVRSKDAGFQQSVKLNESDKVPGYRYKARARNCLTAQRIVCGNWSAFSTSVTPLARPISLDVRPLPLRKAMLTWTGDANAVKYIVEVRERGGSWDPPDRTDPSSGNTSAAKYEGSLDRIVAVDTDNDGTVDAHKGLAHADAYEFRVRATGSNSTYLDSGFSSTVRIIENPIIRGNGDSRNAPKGQGEAEVVWERVANVINGRYTVRTRKLYPPDHHRINWNLHSYDTNLPAIGCESQPCFSLPDKLYDDVTANGAVGTRLTYSRPKLELGKLYGIQLSYEISAGHETIHVFSANDVYVWPSKNLPSENPHPDRVATFPFFGHHKDKDYGYRICKDTFFPDNTTRQADWVKLIEHAFEQWEIATDGFITMTPEYKDPVSREYEDCTSMSWWRPMFLIRGKDDSLSEIRMLDVNIPKAFLASKEISSDIFKLCILAAPACVTSRTDYNDPNRGPSNYLSGVDITFNRSKFEDDDPTVGKRGYWYPRIPVVSFNTCLPDIYPDEDNPDTGYSAYRIVLHEAGHALGLSNVTDQWRYQLEAVASLVKLNPFKNDIYHASHSSTPDSVMNYDKEIFANYDPLGDDPNTQNIDERWQRLGREPDCSPHPIDILAIYALYQVPVPVP